MARTAALLLLLSVVVPAGDPPALPVPLRDLAPRYVQGGRLYRNRTADRPGLFIAGKRHRGLAQASAGRIGFDLDGDFARLALSVAPLDGATAPARFRVLGDGKPLHATPPLFPGADPLALDVDVSGVVLLELESLGEAGPVAWIDGTLTGAPGKDLARYRAGAETFNPGDYPHAFRRRVNDAIAGGVRYLRARQAADGTWTSRHDAPGTTALVALALFKSGVPHDDPALVKTIAWLRAQPYQRVYSVSCLLMALEARWFPKGADPKRAKETIPEDERAWIAEAARWLADQQGAGFPDAERSFHPVWRYPAGGYDLSNTQYALFGLAAAERCGARHAKLWLPALRYLLGVQEKSGPKVSVSRYFRQGDFYRRRAEPAEARGFAYRAEGPATGSMTSAGLCAIVLCQDALRGRAAFDQGYARRTREAIRDALAWLEEYYDLEENPFRGSSWWAYYLFNVERVGVLLDQRYLGTRDWYEEGAELLMATQRADGCLAGDVIDTCFALLFLKRATVAPTTPRGR